MAAQSGGGEEGNGTGVGRGTAPGSSGTRRDALKFVDSHAHLADAAFDGEAHAAIDRARLTGALGVVCVGESTAAAVRGLALAAEHPGFVFATAGIHPHDASSFDPARDVDAIRELIHNGAVAIGECGLDSHYDHAPRELQRRTFAAQLGLARQLDKPVIVHTRDAEDDTLAMVVEAGRAGVQGVLHCYTGSHRLAEAALGVGWYVSFSGIVTFRKWDDDALVRLVPGDRLLVESDAPYLAPVPHRGKRNEPAWVSFTVARIAAARGMDASDLGAETAANTRRLFRLPLSARSES